MEDYQPERHGVGRRQEDQDCADHDLRLSKVEKILDRQYGWLKAAGVFFGVALPIVGYFVVSIDTKLTTILQRQAAGDIVIAEVRRDVAEHSRRINEIDKRHEYMDQLRFK